jgi:hypothetical protein
MVIREETKKIKTFFVVVKSYYSSVLCCCCCCCPCFFNFNFIWYQARFCSTTFNEPLHYLGYCFIFFWRENSNFCVIALTTKEIIFFTLTLHVFACGVGFGLILLSKWRFSRFSCCRLKEGNVLGSKREMFYFTEKRERERSIYSDVVFRRQNFSFLCFGWWQILNFLYLFMAVFLVLCKGGQGVEGEPKNA